MDMGKMLGALTGKPALETMKPDEVTGFKQGVRVSLTSQVQILVVAGMSLAEIVDMLNGCMGDAAETAKLLGRK